MSFSFHCTPCSAGGQCGWKVISLQTLDVTSFVLHSSHLQTYVIFTRTEETQHQNTVIVFINMSLLDRHDLPSLSPFSVWLRTDRKKRWAHPPVPFLPCHDFSPKWRACRGKSHEEEGRGFHGRLCLLHLSAFHSSPGLSEHGPLGLSAPLAGGGRGPLAPCSVDPQEHCVSGVMQTG